MSFDLKLLGEKLIHCRQRLQFELREVAIGTGLGLDRIEKIEAGLLEPTGDEILMLADFYKEDYKFFISNQQKSGSEQTDVLYRKFGDSFSKEDRWAIQEFLYLCECEQNVIDFLSTPKKEFVFQKKGTYFKEHGIQAATSLRSFLGYSDNELLQNIFEDFRKIGIHIFRRKLVNSSISGLFVLHPNAGKCILVNYNEDIYRQNFTLAHETAHSIFDTEEQLNVSFTNEKGDLREIRANTFASHFLIPTNAILQLNVTQWSQEIIYKVAKQLKTNITPLLIRLKELNLIEDEEYKLYSQLYLNEKEKNDFELDGLTDRIKENKKKLIERGLSTYYVRECHNAYINGFISRKRLAEMLLTNEFELPNILNLFNLKLIYEH